MSQGSCLEAKLRSETSLSILGKLSAGSKRLVWSVATGGGSSYALFTATQEEKCYHRGPSVVCNAKRRLQRVSLMNMMHEGTITPLEGGCS